MLNPLRIELSNTITVQIGHHLNPWSRRKKRARTTPTNRRGESDEDQTSL